MLSDVSIERLGIKDKTLKMLKLGETHMAEAKRASSSTRAKKKSTKSSRESAKKTTVEKIDVETTEESIAVAASQDTLENRVAEPEESLMASASSESSPLLEEKKVEPLRTRLSDEYLIQCYFDKTQNQFVATVLELSQIRAVGSSKADVIRDCENRLESHLNLLKRQGESIPETFQSRHYPESLTIPISQGLYRRLDLLSRQEKIGLDELVVELISGMIERRLHGAHRHPSQRHHQHQHGHQGGHRDNHRNENRREGHKHEAPREQRREPAARENSRDNNHREFQNDEDNIGNLKRESHSMQQGRNNRGRGGRHFHKTMESRENFLEYVRNLEKGNWKKR